MNQCWKIVNWTLGKKLQWNRNRNLYIFIQENAFENVVWKMVAILSWPQCVKPDLGMFQNPVPHFCWFTSPSEGTNACPLGNANAFLSWVSKKLAWASEIFLYRTYKGHLFPCECSRNLVSHTERPYFTAIIFQMIFCGSYWLHQSRVHWLQLMIRSFGSGKGLGNGVTQWWRIYEASLYQWLSARLH